MKLEQITERWRGPSTDEATEDLKNLQREAIRRPGEQLELFPSVWNRTDKQAQAAGDVLRWVETYGVYVPTGCAELMERARRYADDHRERLRGIMAKAKFTEQETADVMADYTAAALGVTHYTAAPSLMAKAVRTLPPGRCYTEDKYLFYDMVFEGYKQRAVALSRFESVRGGSIAEKKTYLSIVPLFLHPGEDATAWGLNFGFIDLSEFADVETEDDGTHDPIVFGGFARINGDWYRYSRFVWFAKHALLATPAEVESITKPPFPVEVDDRANYTRYATIILDDLDDWDKFTGETLADNGAGVLSRGLSTIAAGGLVGFKLPDRETPGDNLLTLLRVKQERGEISKIAYESVEKVINGVNLMFAQGGYKTTEDFYTMYTNHAEFAKFCGVDNSNSDTRQQLWKAALFLHTLQFFDNGRSFPPILFYEKQTGEGKGKRSVLTVMLPPEYLNAKNRIMANPAQLKALKGAARGAQARFINLLMTRGHKTEEGILEQIYNHDAELNDAEKRGTAAAARFKCTWTTNKTKRKKQLREWFKKAKADGVIASYRYTTTGKNGAVYQWTTHDTETAAVEVSGDAAGEAKKGVSI